MSRPRGLSLFVLVIVSAAFAVTPAHAQSEGAIVGFVFDNLGFPLPGATVTVRSLDTGTDQDVLCEADGAFAFRGLAPGSYDVQVAIPGFQTGTSTTTVAAGAEVTLEFTLVPTLFTDEILVTGLKRGEQRLVDVPMPVTAVGGEELEELGAQGLLNVIQSAPGATAYETGPGINTIQIRGISVSAGDSPIGYYLDETPFALVGTYYAPDVSMFDLERVEVLRGPQGTLYGDGALGGVLRFISQNPDLQEVEAKGDVSFGTYTGGEDTLIANAAVSVPVVKDVFAIRATASYRDLGGWVDSPYFGENINDQTYKNLRLKGLVKASDRVSIILSAWFNRFEADGTNDANDEGVMLSPVEQPSDGFYDVYSGIVRWEAKAFSLISATSFIKQEWDATVGMQLAPGFGTEAGLGNQLDSFSQEVRLTSKSTSAFAWTAGAFYRDAETPTNLNIPAFGLVSEYINTSESIAVFGEGVYTFGKKVDVTLGLRYFEDQRTTDDVTNQISGEGDFDDLAPRFNLAYRRAPGQLFYLNIAKGFRSGQVQSPFSTLFAGMIGLEIPDAVDPEDAWTYEIGAKREFGPKLTLEGALYYTDYKDLQTFLPIGGSPFLAFYNVGSARIPGIDLLFRAQPTSEWSFNVGGNWNAAEYAEDAYVDGVLVYEEGQRIQNVPELSLNGGVRYSKAFGGRGWLGFGDLRAQYSSERFQETGDSAGTTTSSDKIFTAQFRAGVMMPWGELAFFVNNLTNERGAIAPPFSSRYGQSRLPPREIGLNLKLRL